MIAKTVRIGAVEDQDRFHRKDVLVMTPEERIQIRIKLRNQQFGRIAKPIRNSGIVSYRQFSS